MDVYSNSPEKISLLQIMFTFTIDLDLMLLDYYFLWGNCRWAYWSWGTIGQEMAWCRRASSLCLELCSEDKLLRHLISSSKWEVSTYVNAVIYSLAVSEVCAQMIGCIMVPMSYSLVYTFNHDIIIIQNCTSIEHIIGSVVMYALFGVRQDKAFISFIFYAIYGVACYPLAYFSFDYNEDVSASSYRHLQIRMMTHLPLIRVRSRNNGMCCMSYCVLIDH